MSERLYVDIHVIETLPPSCVNRDDLGSPKTAVYGGVTRARVSSQAWKHAIREEFKKMGENIGKRSKRISDFVVEKIKLQNPSAADPEALAKKILEIAGFSFNDKSQRLKALFFISPAQIEALARIAKEYKEELDKLLKAEKGEKKASSELENACQEAIKNDPCMDIALFGRMLATDPNLNFDATAQVAHAISTHEVHTEFDYFTAVDDFDGAVGAGHLGTTEFNSSTMYRYATVNVLELFKSQKEMTPHIVRAFLDAFIRSMPAGRQNSFANRVRPNAVYVAVRLDQPVNMVGAFEKPVQADKNGYVEGSVRSLVKYAVETYSDYYKKPELSLVIGDNMDKLGEKMSLAALLEKLETYLTENLPEKEQK